MCINQPGSFQCSCNSSYSLDSNGHTCSRVQFSGLGSADNNSTTTLLVSVVLSVIIVVLLIILAVTFIWYYCTSKGKNQVLRSKSPELYVNPPKDWKFDDATTDDLQMMKQKEDAV